MKGKNNIGLKKNIGNLGFIIKFLLKTNKSLLLVFIPLIILRSAASLLSVIFLRIIVNGIAYGGNLNRVLLITLAMAFSLFLMNSLESAINAYMLRQKEKTSKEVKLVLGSAVSRMKFECVEDPRIKDFIELASTGSNFEDMVDRLGDISYSFINAVTYISLLTVIQPVIIVLIAAAILLNILINKLKRINEESFRQHRIPIERKMAYYINLLSDPRYGKELRVNRLKDYFIHKYQTELDVEYTPNVRKSAVRAMSLEYLIELSQVLQNVLIYAILAVNVVFHGMRIGDFTMYVASASNVTSAIKNLIDNISSLLNMGEFAKEFKYCISLSSERRAAGSFSPVKILNYDIEFRNVSFKYPNTDKYILRDISFVIGSGEKISLVGINGAGKTTLVKLICGFYILFISRLRLELCELF